jgi:hypothetical protein
MCIYKNLVQDYGPGKILKQQASTYLTKILVILSAFWPEVWYEVLQSYQKVLQRAE